MTIAQSKTPEHTLLNFFCRLIALSGGVIALYLSILVVIAEKPAGARSLRSYWLFELGTKSLNHTYINGNLHSVPGSDGPNNTAWSLGMYDKYQIGISYTLNHMDEYNQSRLVWPGILENYHFFTWGLLAYHINLRWKDEMIIVPQGIQDYEPHVIRMQIRSRKLWIAAMALTGLSLIMGVSTIF